MDKGKAKRKVRQRPITVNGVNYAKIDKKRNLLGMNYVVLCNRTDITPTRMCSLFQGKSQWRVTDIRDVLAILDIDPQEVISDEAVLKYYYRELEAIDVKATDE